MKSPLIYGIVCAVACIGVVLVCLSGTFASAAYDPVDYRGVTSAHFEASNIDGILETFLSENPDRTARPGDSTEKVNNPADPDGAPIVLSVGERAAAEWLETSLKEILGDAGTVETSKYTHRVKEHLGSALGSDVFNVRNVTARIAAPMSASGKKIVIGTNYDNNHTAVSVSGYGKNGSEYVYFYGTKAEGAVLSGTGVATALALASYFARDDVRARLPLDVEFAFYGMSAYDNFGSHIYEANCRDDIAIAFNLGRLGSDKLYAYFDESSTAHGRFVMETARSLGYGDYISEPSVLQGDVSEKNTDVLPYTPPALRGDAAAFYGKHPVCSLTSAVDSAFWLSDKDVAGGDSVAGTNADTLSVLREKHPNYADQLAVAAEVIASSVLREGFVEACAEGEKSVGGYAWLGVPLVGTLTVIVLAGAVLAVSVAVGNRMRKKYASAPPPEQSVKVEVFGAEYENTPNGKDGSGGSDDPFDEDFLNGGKR